MATQPWWTEAPAEAQRRLRLLRRRDRLRAHPSKHVPLAPPRAAGAGVFIAVPVATPATALSAVLEPAEPGLLRVAPPATESGSVNLEGVVNTEPAQPAPRTARGGSKARAEAKREDALEAEPELSLAKRLAYLLQPPLENLLSQAGPLEWPYEFFAYQRDGIQALLEKSALLLADDMGLGKTAQAIAALRILIRTRQAETALLVAPASLLVQWRRAIREWAPELRTSTVSGAASERAWKWQTSAHVYIVGYETLRADFTDNPQSPPRRRIWDVVVLDEAQKIKNRGAEVSQECKRLQRRRAWALTGTPLENSADDLASICEFVTPWVEGEDLLHLTPGPDLFARHQDLQLRRKKADVLTQLPAKTTSEITLQLTGSQRASYEDAERNGVVYLKKLGQTARITH